MAPTAAGSLGAMIRGRLRRHGDERAASAPEDEYIEIDPGELTGIFSVPEWLRDVGLMSWLLVGIALFVAGMIWLLGLTQVIVAPGDRRSVDRRGRLAAGRLARPAPGPAGARGGPRPARRSSRPASG